MQDEGTSELDKEGILKVGGYKVDLVFTEVFSADSVEKMLRTLLVTSIMNENDDSGTMEFCIPESMQKFNKDHHIERRVCNDSKSGDITFDDINGDRQIFIFNRFYTWWLSCRSTGALEVLHKKIQDDKIIKQYTKARLILLKWKVKF